MKVRIPPGVEDGQRIRIPGRGQPGADGAPAGDLFVLVRVGAHPRFGRRGAELTVTVPVTYPQAVLGGEVEVPTLDGPPVTVRVPAGTPSGRTLRVKGHGGPRPGGGRGDLLVTVEVAVPRHPGSPRTRGRRGPGQGDGGRAEGPPGRTVDFGTAVLIMTSHREDRDVEVDTVVEVGVEDVTSSGVTRCGNGETGYERPERSDMIGREQKRVDPAPSIVACPSCGTRNRVPAAATGAPRCARCKTSLPWVVDADDATFGLVTSGAPVPVVVDLWAPWCAPCRTISPILEQLAGEFAGQAKLVKVNVDRAPQVQARFGVQGIPMLVVLRDGLEVARQVGAAPADQLRSWIASNLGQPA